MQSVISGFFASICFIVFVIFPVLLLVLDVWRNKGNFSPSWMEVVGFIMFTAGVVIFLPDMGICGTYSRFLFFGYVALLIFWGIYVFVAFAAMI